MARDVKKKFTITLDIGTGDAEKQLKSTAENIKKTLKSLSDESNSLKYFNELADMVAQIDAQMANLKATYGDGFDGLFDKISASVKNDFQNIFDFARKKLAEFNNDIQADKTHLDSLNAMMAEYKKASKVGEQAFNLDKITGFKGTKKEVQELYAVFDQLVEAKKQFESSGDFTSEAYIKNYIQLMKTAAGLINADKLSENEGKDFGIDVEALSNKAEKAKGILKEMFGSASTNPASHLNVWMQLDGSIKASISSLNSWAEALAEVMSDSIKAALNGDNLVAQNKKSAESYNQLTAKVQEYIDAQKQLKTLEKGSQARKDALKRVGTIQGDILSMKDLDDDQIESAYDIFEEINSGAISSKDAINKLCGLLQIDMPDGMSEMVSAASTSFDQVGKHAVDATEYVRGMTLAIKEMFNVLSKASDVEYKALIGGQNIAIKMGQNKEVSSKSTAEAYLANIMQDTDVDAHSHQGLAANIDVPDFLQAIRRQYSGVAKLSAIIGNKDIVTLDLAKVKAEDAYAALNKLKELTSKKGKEAASVEELNQIFANINPEYANIAQRWNPEQFGNLAEKIFDIKQNFQQALDPAQKLKNILTAIAGRNVDFSKYDDLLKTLTKDNVGAIFNQIAQAENIQEDGKILQVESLTTGTVQSVIDNIQKQKEAFADLRQSAKLTYQEISDAITDFANNYNKKNDQDFEFLNKYFHPEEIQNIRNMVMDVGDGFRDLDGVIKQVSTEFGIDPDEIEQFDAAQAKMKEFLSLAKTYNEMEYISESDVNSGIQKLQEMRIELSELAEQGQLTSKDLQAINDAFDITETHLTAMDHDAYQGGGKYNYTYAHELMAAEEENARLRQELDHSVSNEAYDQIADLSSELAALREVNTALQAEHNILQSHADFATEQADQLAKENSLLEHKLELLQEIANQYGATVTKKDRDRYEQLVDKEMDVGLTEKEEDRQFELAEKIEEADSAMEEFGETYDKIILKLANGKNVEILPDDKGLRALDKIANEYYDGEYNGQEIQDVLFVRKQEQEVIAQTNQQLEDQLQIQQQIAQVTKAYDDVFDVLHNVGNRWKDLDTVDSAIGSMSLSEIDTYVKELERLVKLIESVDPNFQHGDKDEYDGAVKTLEKLQTLSDRTKLTDEFKNIINQFEQLGKFQWSDDLTNGYLKILNDIRNGTYKTIGQCVAKFNELSAAAAEPKLMEPTEALKELVNYVSKSGSTPKTFFSKLEAGAIDLNDELKNILQSLDAIGTDGKAKLTSLQAGYINQGGFVSDKYAMIARPMKSSYGVNYLKKAQNLQGKLQDAQKAGAQIGAIFQIIEDATHNLFYEVQNTVPGTAAFSHHKQTINADIANASAEQLEQLANTMQILAKNGLFIDFGGDNILYDKDKGFSVIDLGVAGGQSHTVSYQNTLQENLDRFVKEIFSKSSASMKQTLQDGLVKNLYASAQKLDAGIVNPYAPKQTQTAKAAQTASAQTAAAVQKETDKHEDNTAAIKAENDALKAQIELKKKAQSMKWEAFATDDSLATLKQAAGMQTLGQLEGFWKKSNYEKQIDFHEIPEADAKQIFKDKLPKGLASKWYSSADFLSKSKLENEILADDEIRNAAMSYFWHMFKNSYVTSKHPNIKTFDDFINNEFTMYRGDQAPLIYDPSSKLSFSINESTANGFNANLGTIKIKPKDTIGNAGSAFTSELETFAPSEQTSWFQKNREAFADFYAKQTKEMQKELDAGFVNFEKKRISDIIGDDLSTLAHKALQSSYWKHNVADDLKNSIVPDQITVPTDGSDYAQFATMYNGLSDTMKRFVMFFASMDDLSASLPKPFSISVPTAGGGFKYGKNAVGAGAELFNAVLNDPEGRHQHIARLTGEKAFNLMGVTPAEINAVADAHERNAQAINTEAQAQKDLNSLQDRYDMVMDDLWDSAVDADGSKHNDLSKLWSQLYDVQHSDQDLVNQGLYTQKSTGQDIDATDIFQLVVDIESKYNENLDYVKDYLKQVYSGIDFEGMVPQPISAYESTKTKTYEAAKSAYKSGNQREYFKLLGVLNHLNDIDAASDEDITAAQYTDTDTGRRYDISNILGMVKSIEDAYGENLDYVYDYLKQVYGEATIDDAVAKLQKNDTRAERRPETKYTVEDYQNAYAAAPSDMQEAIDDLAVFQQRYEQLYALTNQRPIEFMFPGKPTLNEAEEVMAIFDEFKAKQQQILHLQLLDYEGNKEQIQELQAEAVGLQNKLRGASLGENADLSEYKMTYGFIDDQDADRFKKLVDMVESVHTVMNDLTRIGEHKMSLIPQEMQDMLDSDTGDTAEQFMAQQAKQVQSAKAAAQQADASVAASKQRLQTEQDITAEKQRQASIDDQQATQTTTDAATNQNVQAEVAALETLNQKIEQVKFAVALKTSAFEQEAITVNKVVNEEIAALEKLKTLLTEIQNALQVIFAANNWNIGDINTQQSKTSSNAMPNMLEAIKSTLEQIYGVLSKTNGVEADNKNSVKVKKPAVENKPIDSDAYKALAAKIPDDLAKDGTLQQILGAVNIIAKRPKDSENADLANLSAALLVASTELKTAASGIIEQKKKAQSDTSVAQARIANKDEYVQIKSAALGSLGDRALESEVTEMQALANGVVKVTGWLRVAEDAWEGFTVQINEANEASKLAFSTSSKAAKQAAAQAKALAQSDDDDEDLNIKKYSPEETKARAQEKIAKYTAEGKIATVQFKDSGKYTITILEKIGGLTKQIFQTFDENDEMIERTTATMSNSTLAKIQDLQKIAQFGLDNDLISEDNQLYKDFQKASQELEEMNFMYSQTGQLSDDQIANWKLQIDLVSKLGKQVQTLVAQTKNPAINTKVNKAVYGATPVINAQAKFNTLSSRAQPYTDSGWSDITAALNQYETAMKNLIALQNQFKNGQTPTDSQKTQFVQYKDACNAASKELKKLLDMADRFNSESHEIQNISDDINVDDRNVRADALKTYVQEVYGAQAVIGKFNGDMTELQFTIKNTDGTITNMTAAFNSAKTQIGALHGETKKATTIFDELGNKFQELWRYAAARMGVDEVIQAVRKGVEYVREIDNALTDLKKVTDETDATYAQFLQTMSKTAGTVGSTVADLTTMAAEWGRLGYSLQEAGMLAESTAILLNVSEFDDATTASEALISTMQAFGYAADESQHVVDILNEVKVTCLLV